MKRVFQSFFLGVVLFGLCLLPSYAVTPVDLVYSQTSVDAWNSVISDWILDTPVGNLTSTAMWNVLDRAMGAAVPGRHDSLSSLEGAASSYNSSINSLYSLEKWAALMAVGHYPQAKVDYVSTIGGWALVDKISGMLLVNSQGAYAYYIPETESGDEVNVYGGKWIGSRTCDSTNKVVILSDDVLSALTLTLNEAGETCVTRSWSHAGQKYNVICKDNYYYYCNSDGYPYVSRVEDKSYASNQENNYYVDMGDNNVYNEGDTVNGNLIDIEDNSIWFPDGTLAYINELIYDESTKTYYVDAHKEYNIESNTYVTYNYFYTYHINYTSITYIGATEEYNEVYELYYQLPDGRSSADLTADELLALNTSIDVVPYIRSADNTALRSLYHFDGNTNDSSYWNYTTSFDWVEGASITYLESNAFNGCLYLDETEHEFKISAPSGIGSQDFTLQWRMYNSATIAPVSDSYVAFGGTQLFTFSGSYITFDGTQYSVPVGNWYEVALIRDNGILRLYLNGVQVASKTVATVFGKDITFHFGDEQQTYKQIDEMRLLNFALVTDGESYTPTSVPYDTNLALVLPDSTVPVADEYWDFNSEGNCLSVYDFTDAVDGLYYPFSSTQSSKKELSDSDLLVSGIKYHTTYSNVETSEGYTIFTNKTSSVPAINGTNYPSQFYACGGFAYGLGETFSNDNDYIGEVYTVSILLKDGTLYSTTGAFGYPDTATGGIVTGDGGYLALASGYNSGSYYYGVIFAPPAGSSWEVVYIELVKGESPNTGHEFVTGISPVNSDFNTPTLAVRTDLEITGYQIGGVRPSLPTKGLVWALVEDGRITSLQIYNGQAWEAVDGRVWTGSRWVPYYAYDVLLLKDMYDIIEADPSQEYIYTEAGFWSWLQKAWGQMMAKLEEIRLAIVSGGSGGGSVPDDSILPGGSDGSSADGDGGWSFLDLLIAVKDGVWKVTTGLVSTGVDGVSGLIQSVNNVGDYFDAFDSDSSANILGIYSYGGDDIWD